MFAERLLWRYPKRYLYRAAEHRDQVFLDGGMEESEQYVPCETVVGIIAGRDAIYLDDVQYTPSALCLTLRGDLNGSLCSQNKGGAEWITYELTFLGVFAFRMIEIDLSGWRGQSSFDKVRNSTWLSELLAHDKTQSLSSRHNHFYVMTYDHVFDIIAKSYSLSTPPTIARQ